MNTNINNGISETEKKATGSIAHATDILTTLSNDVHSVTDIARQCHLTKSTVHRVLKMLAQSQMVVEDTINRRYYIGPLVMKLASNPNTVHKRLINIAAGDMKRLSNITEETVAMDVMVGIQYLSLLEISSKHDLKFTQEHKKIGLLYSRLYAGSTVKILLSQLDNEKLRMVLNNVTITPETERTVTDKELLMAQLEEIRQKGYAISYGERVLGAMCVAAPVNNYILPLVLCVVGPESRLQPRVKEVVVELKETASRISSKIAGIFSERR